MSTVTWTIDAVSPSGKGMVKFPIDKPSLTVGRVESSDFAVPKNDVSRVHAEITKSSAGLTLRDLGSTNGTFVNHQRIDGEVALHHGDVIHFGAQEFRVMCVETEVEAAADGLTALQHDNHLSNTLPVGLSHLQRLIDQRQVKAVFQSIVTPDGSLYATEALGRGTCEELPTGPWPLFQLAESGEVEVDLSRLFRRVASETAYQQAPETTLFLNSHPSELNDIDALLESMLELDHTKRGLRTVLEVHEDGISDLVKLRDLQISLREMNIGLAYDDFGAGQSRLRELTEVPPDYLKFDMGLIRDIDKAPAVKRNLLTALAETANASGTTTLAEGVATKAELDCCIEMGMSLIQGFYFAKPMPLIPESD